MLLVPLAQRRRGGFGEGPAPTPARPLLPGRRVRLGYHPMAWGVTPILAREDFLGRRGWQVEYAAMPAPPGRLVRAFVDGQVDALVIPPPVAARLWEEGVALRVTGVGTAVIGAVVAHREAGIAGAADLRGRRTSGGGGSRP